MQQEYTISTAKKIFYFVLAALLLGFSIFFFQVPKNSNNIIITSLAVLGFMIFSIYVVISSIRKRLIIYDDRIIFTGAFSSEEIDINDIKGFRIVQQKSSRTMILESDSDKKIRVSSFNDFENSDEIEEWAKRNFKNLDVQEIEKEHNELLHDSTIGVTEEDREANLKNAKIITVAYNIGGGLAGFMTLFYDTRLMVIVLMGYPLIGIVLLVRSKGLIKFLSNPKRSVYPYIGLGALLSAFIPLIKSLNDYNIFNTDHLWLPVLIISGILFILLFLTGLNKSMPAAGQYILMLALAVIFGFGTVLRVNYMFDDSTAQAYQARVFDRTVSHGKSTSYYLKISKWGLQKMARKVSVSRELYTHTQIGDTVHVNFKTGKLGIPWYTVSK